MALLTNGVVSPGSYQWLLDERLIDQFPRVIYRELPEIDMSHETVELITLREKVLEDLATRDQWDEGKFRAVATRWEAAILTDLCGTNASCLENSLFAAPGTRPGAAALRVIVDDFPVPLENIPFQDIVELRRDPEFVAKRAPLRNWCRKLGELSDASIRDELAVQLHDYQQYMQVQRIKYARSSLEIFLTTPLGVLEDLLKLKLTGAVSRLLKISEARVALAEAELKAPSRELGLIVHTSEQLGRPGR